MDKYTLISETFCEGAVRCLGLSPASLYNIYILSGGQDNVCRQFVEDGGNLAPVGEPLHHDHWVTALASLPAGVSQAHPEGCVVTGCMDGIIRVYSADFSSQLMQLRGHAEKKGVISLAFNCDHSLLFSGSWDGSAIAWDLEKEHHAALVRQFPGHENGVHVLGLADGSLATVSSGEAVNSQPANFKLRLWDVSSGEKKAEIYDHRASIRSIKHTALGFMTTANDGTIALRTADGERIGEVCHPLQDDGSPAIILDCCALAGSDTDFVSVGEDGSCCLWSGLRLVQALPHPCTLWCVAALPNGDFVTGDSNGCIRLFSRRSAEEAGFDDAAVCLLCDKFDAQTAEALETRRKGPGAAEIAQVCSRWSSIFLL
jgi:phospholipase A-2-activating protein